MPSNIPVNPDHLQARLIVAAGGYVIRAGAAEPELLLIHRRGVWDLPKGKQKTGEDLRECAERELKEELGIASVELLRPVGMSIHSYSEPANGRYVIKTTYWFLARTAEEHFVPEAGEQIDAVDWVPWSEAIQRLGFESLRHHAATVAPFVEESLRAGLD